MGPPGESYPEFTARVAEESRMVKAKCDALDVFTPRCTYCGQTCEPIEAGSTCKANGMQMVSRWAHDKADVEWFRLGHFGGSWSGEVTRLAALLDRIRAGET